MVVGLRIKKVFETQSAQGKFISSNLRYRKLNIAIRLVWARLFFF